MDVRSQAFARVATYAAQVDQAPRSKNSGVVADRTERRGQPHVGQLIDTQGLPIVMKRAQNLAPNRVIQCVKKGPAIVAPTATHHTALVLGRGKRATLQGNLPSNGKASRNCETRSLTPRSLATGP